MDLDDHCVSVPFQNVSITSDFWIGRSSAVQEGALPAMLNQMKETGRWDSLKLQWKPGDPKKPHRFWDSDVAKWLEAACYLLISHPDPELASQVEEAVDLIRGAQQKDGYLNTYYTVVEPGKRWTNIAWSHEMYCAGHLLEAGLAHHAYTHSTRLLGPLLKYIAHIKSVFGPEEDHKHGYPGHQCLELALLKAYETTGDKSLLDLAHYFIEERGQIRSGGHYYDIEARERNDEPFIGPMRRGGRRYEYHQADRPVRDIESVQGHSVRTMYWLTAVANLARLTKDESLRAAAERLWESTTERKMYVTGGLGAIGDWEGFGPDYFLPNETGYLETCAAVGLVFFAHQMLLLDPRNTKYAEVMERALYNGALVGMSMDGKSFFYDNPPASVEGTSSRSDWFEVACCPPNVARLIGSLSKYIYTLATDDTVYVHLYISSAIDIKLSTGNSVKIVQESNEPWQGGVKFTISGEGKNQMKLVLRKPVDARGFAVHVGDTLVPSTEECKSSIILLDLQNFSSSNSLVITVSYFYRARLLHPHPLDSANYHHIAIARGPFVYCAETIDNPDIPDLRAIRCASDDATLGLEEVIDREKFAKWGIECVFLKTSVWVAVEAKWKDLTLVPLFMWANRGKSDLRVWLPSQ